MFVNSELTLLNALLWNMSFFYNKFIFLENDEEKRYLSYSENISG